MPLSSTITPGRSGEVCTFRDWAALPRRPIGRGTSPAPFGWTTPEDACVRRLVYAYDSVTPAVEAAPERLLTSDGSAHPLPGEGWAAPVWRKLYFFDALHIVHPAPEGGSCSRRLV